MSPETVEFLQDAGNVTFGAVLGFAGALVLDWWKDRRRATAMQHAIRRELRETAHRFLGLVYTLGGRHGMVNRELLIWMKHEIERYSGGNPSQNMLAGVSGLLGQTDEQIAELSAHLQATTAPQFVPLEDPAYTAASVAAIHDLDPDFASRVLDVLAHVRMLNDARENGLFHTRLTFTPGLTEENHRSAQRGIDDAEKMMVNRARIVIGKISLIEDMHPGE